MFSDKLNELLSALGATSVEIGRYAGFDRTNISHLRNGKRTIKPESTTAVKLARGIVLCAENLGKHELFCTFLSVQPDTSPEELQNAAIRWLFAGECEDGRPEGTGPSGSPSLRKWHTFGERLDQTMSLTGFSNIRLSRLVYADPSLISRYRRGVRSPAGNPDLACRIADELWKRIQRNGMETDLARLLRIPLTQLTQESFSAWLTGNDATADSTLRDTESLLDIFDGCLTVPRREFPSATDILQETAKTAKKSIYRGTEGFRDAVLRFLTDALQSSVPELMLYSDEDMNWMVEDSVFFGKWASLMVALVSNGTRIRIIHTIERELAEMNRAIVSWLPLYFSGRIESYYCKFPKSVCFSHTLFLSPGKACIAAFHTTGTETDGIYQYYTDPALLSLCEAEYTALMKNCGTLLKTGNLTPYQGNSDICFVQNTLRIGTMSEELADSFRNPALRTYWQNVREASLTQLKNHRITEYISLASDEDLFAGNTLVETCPGTLSENKKGIKILRYTPEQYIMHIRNILQLLEMFPNYTLIPIPEAPFPNIKLLIADDLTRIDMLEQPELSFGFTHPLMCRAFLDYIRTISSPYVMKREELRQMLESRYL